SINDSILCWLATANTQDEPNVSPKEMFVAYRDKNLLIADIASINSTANIKENPCVCVSLIEITKQKGFKRKGAAEVVESSDKHFESLLGELHNLGGEAFPVRNIIKITKEAAEPIIAPSYWLFADMTEQSQANQAMESYGVRPKI
ncbi:MAG: pyridoxamine 5'-phosphate oxidase family protein, partial [Gammaproteobacteria bacterium]|nr:pyridoxamine 5'-phosphate oxidase family protein [Gammaproteobacteria bacterium]